MWATTHTYITLANALLMTILAKAFLSFVGRHFMALTLFTAWHWSVRLKVTIEELWALKQSGFERVSAISLEVQQDGYPSN